MLLATEVSPIVRPQEDHFLLSLPSYFCFPMLSLEQVRKHNTRKDCWVIIHGKAYDVSDFVDEHPGGSAIILKYAGKDATKAFDPIHPSDTLDKYLNKKHHKGDVDMLKRKEPRKASLSADEASEKSALAKKAGEEPDNGPKLAESDSVDEFDVEYDEHPSSSPAAAPLHASGAAVSAEDDDDEYDDDEDDPPSPEELTRRQLVKKKPDLSQIYNLLDFEFVARHTMEKVAWAYYSSGCDDEITLRENHIAYHRIYFKPRVLVDVTSIDTLTSLLGTRLLVPFYILATALGRLGHEDGEKVLTRAAGQQGVIQMIPTLASCLFDEIVDAAIDQQTQWLQLYVNANYEVNEGIIKHAEKRGIKGLFITVDAPQLGRREKDMRLKNVDDISHVQGEGDNADRSQGAARAILSFIDTRLSWLHIAWFRKTTRMPIVLKGIGTVEDSLLAVEHGVEGIVLLNHGGRQLEFLRPPIEVLAELMPILRAKGWERRIEVFIDGGVRRATDILKAVALGARGVGIGRPFLYAMLTYGDEGVFKAIQILKDEMIMNMRLLGVTRIDQLNENYVDVRSLNRPVPEDRLFGSVYQPLASPSFKDTKL